jgi:hypothetical protein
MVDHLSCVVIIRVVQKALISIWRSMATETTRQCLARVSRRNNIHKEVTVLWEDPSDDITYIRCKLHATNSYCKIDDKKTTNTISLIISILKENHYNIKELTDIELCILFASSKSLDIIQEHLDSFKIPIILLLKLASYGI